ncbi:hypothetical protein BP6252_06351 [Coleophoma cylindrospora]|uniref:SP-RING-type domain-containing protein n=1 Tax=Coleophoma cylindrospora TaxID=1849047 RepID=A0A3D8RMD1_9HELO|nr:hypothetical protein BP6252_06351 [Coleophoma cylindrospora]
MSGRGRLVPRGRRDHGEANTQDATALPPYEPPSYPLNVGAKRALDSLAARQDTAKYKNHLKRAIHNVTYCAVEPADRLYSRQKKLKQQAEKRRQPGRENEEKTDAEMHDEEYAEDFEKKVDQLTIKAEKALRELIDFSDELALHEQVLKDVNEQIPAPVILPSAETRRLRRRAQDEDDAEVEEEEVDQDAEAPAEDVEILSAIEILKNLKEDHKTAYAEKTMRAKYASNNDYLGFKRQVHDARHPGPDAPPLPRASTWFPEEAGDIQRNHGAARRRRTANSGLANSDEDSDDDVQIAGITNSLKCPLTIRLMVHPLSNHVCKHNFEKDAILSYLQAEGVSFPEGARGRGPRGPKKVKCPQSGCEAMIGEADFFEDQLLIRQVRRAAREEAGDFDDDDENYGPRGSQRNAVPIDDFDVTQDIDEDDGETRRQTLLRIKHERLSSRGLSKGPSAQESSPEPDEDEIEAV